MENCNLEVVKTGQEDNQFIEPHFIEELGELGLTAADIAKSLDTAAGDVRKKLQDRGFLERIKAQGFQAVAIAMVNKVNGLPFTEIAMDVSAAKFFVAKYDSPRGDAYLAFLINLEKKVTELDLLIQEDPILKEIAVIQKMRIQQYSQEKRLKAQENITQVLIEKQEVSVLTTTQKKCLKGLIDSTARAHGDIKLAGAIERDLKNHFRLNLTNDRWYHIAQKDYEEAMGVVQSWGYKRR